MKRRFVVNYIDPETGANSAIDNVIAEENYTAADYIRDCEKNSDPEYIDMLHDGTVELEPVDDDCYENVCDFIRAHRDEVYAEVRSAWMESVNQSSPRGVVKVVAIEHNYTFTLKTMWDSREDRGSVYEHVIVAYDCCTTWDIMTNGMDDFFPDILTESEKNAVQQHIDPDELYNYDDYDAAEAIMELFPSKWNEFCNRFIAETADLIRHSFDEDIDAALEDLAD